MKITEFLKNNILYLDGGMGTLLQASGLMPGELPEIWNISHPETVKAIHKSYFDAGSNVVSTNTFGANILKFSDEELDAIVAASVRNARAAISESIGVQPKWVALDIGPSGRMLKPYGDFEFEDAVRCFAETVKLGVKYGVDLIFIETMNDSYETKAALLAAKENSELPVFVSNAYGEDGKLMTGASPDAMVAMLEGMGADAIGVNCSLGPKALGDVVKRYLSCSSLPVILKPNAGLPRSVEGKTVYDVSAEEFAKEVEQLCRLGVRVIGGCCGTTPDYIRSTVNVTSEITPVKITDKRLTVVSSYTHAVRFADTPILIGERINPTGKKRFKEALRASDINYILSEGIAEQEHGAHILDVNVGLPDIDECALLRKSVTELQSVINLPLQIDTSSAIAMEAALRVYNGKPMINSVSGKEESMREIFPLAKKYGGVIVALTLDESGIPASAEGRVEIARRIIAVAAEYGIDKKDLIFDPLAMAISADNQAASETLMALRIIKNELGCHTSLGVSNVSFGLPLRDTINSAYFTLALENGLSAAIMNPHSTEMMKAYYTYRALKGLDINLAEYISFAQSVSNTEIVENSVKMLNMTTAVYKNELQKAIIKGLSVEAANLTREYVKEHNPLDAVNDEIIPALNIVGEGFEKKTVYLPELLMSAEAAKSAFEVIKESATDSAESAKCRVVIATVKGDIHDIGKNIVKLILENYGFMITDLGKDVAPEVIVDKVVELKAPIVGLSALMTTTVPAMEETVKLLRLRAPWCKIMVGGAVLTKEYAEQIGADAYASDAMEGVRYCESINAAL